MDRVIDQFAIDKYTVLILDQKSNMSKEVKIGTNIFSAQHPFGSENSIAVLGVGNFIGKTVEYL